MRDFAGLNAMFYDLVNPASFASKIAAFSFLNSTLTQGVKNSSLSGSKMGRCFFNLKRLLLLAGAVTAAVCPGRAQPLMQQGQPIIFSAPDDSSTASNAPSLAARTPDAPDFSDAVRAPDFNFKNLPKTGTRLPPPPPATISPAEADRRANWMLMTPAEILGVATPEEILKIPERDAAGQRKNLTVTERYNERQHREQTNGNGGLWPDTQSLHGDFSENKPGRLSANDFNQPGKGFSNPDQTDDPFLKPPSGNGATAAQNGNAGWSKIFISSETAPVQSPSQAADMAEFRKLLEPGQPSKSSKPSSGDGLFSPLQSQQGSAFGQPASPSGTSLGQFNNGVGGLPPMPGVIGQNVSPTLTTAPDWRPKLPPWMSQEPQQGVVPKRKF